MRWFLWGISWGSCKARRVRCADTPGSGAAVTMSCGPLRCLPSWQVAATLQAVVEFLLKPAERKPPLLPPVELISGACSAADAMLGAL